MALRLTHLEAAIDEIKESTRQIADAMTTIAVLEERHSETRDGLQRAFQAIERIELRLEKVEIEMPDLKRVRNWMYGAVVGVVAAVGTVGTAIVSGMVK